MPIIDPSLLISLFNNFQTSDSSDLIFFYRYLKIASNNIYLNSNTVESSIQFKRNLKNNIDIANSVFNCGFSIEKDFKNPMIKNFYKHFYNSIDSIFKGDESKNIMRGKFFFHEKFNLHFYRPTTVHNLHGIQWYLTKTQLAILCVDVSQIDKKIYEDLIFLALIEVDLLVASGFTIVICIKYVCKPENSLIFHFLMNSLKFHKFAEIHLDLEYSKGYSNYLNNSLTTIYENIFDIHSYFYFYSQFFDNISSKAADQVKKLKKQLNFHAFLFSQNVDNCINYNKLVEVKPFAYCHIGFKTDLIPIRLSNVPLYDTEDDENDTIPSQSSGVSTCYIAFNDFYNFSQTRVKVLFDDENRNNVYFTKYIYFDDIHLIRPDLYVIQTLYLTNMDNETLKFINEIRDTLYNKYFKKESKSLKKKSIFSLSEDKKILNAITYVTYAYTYCINQQNNNVFNIRNNQIFTALEACKICSKDNNNHTKGIVYQVETGEGKSCIICLIAAALALMKKKVHITSSNITLANRDYNDSYIFFQQLGLKSAILLHYNELPINITDDKNNDDNTLIYNPKYYPDEYFKKSLFKNSSNMNFCVCGITNDNDITKDKADIVFSTIVNFESLYLKITEIYPSYNVDYFGNCSLIMDEADSILIDELTNGTILSRSMKTNGNEILEFVYKSYYENKSQNDVFHEIQNKWPKCIDITFNDVAEMFKEIKLIEKDEFSNGKKYSIETIEIKEKLTLKSLIKNSKELIKNTKKKVKDKAKSIFHKKKKDKDKEEKKKKEKENENEKKSNVYKYIVPFDYDHKGVLEPNKEFSGFIQQFIAIKEKLNNKENQNMLIKDVSMNYLYVSHQILTNLYGNVCGLTGTIGNKIDKQVFKEHYYLTTKKIPKENANLRIEYPTIVCNNISERNIKIVSEIIHFNKLGNPVLVIFQDLNEISVIFKQLHSKGIKNINIFDGKDDRIKPDKISGLNGAVSLGTNVCGRGTDIKRIGLPLHVIVTYFSSNLRVLQQAFGRTARQGNEGSVRIICIKSQFLSPISSFEKNTTNKILEDYKARNNLQNKFIGKFMKNRKWIFIGNMKEQNFSSNEILTLRNTRINVNRIKACNFEFPICMSIDTFLIIQSQKIFSLYNCPNCKYTWMLFQKYLREMILESWSLFIDKIERYFNENQINDHFYDHLNAKSEELYQKLCVYLPESNNPKEYDVIPTFLYIYNLVKLKFEEKIMGKFPDNLIKCFKQSEKNQFLSFTIGFKPYSLVDKSGARINTIDGEEQEQTYIKDPELKYMRKVSKKGFSFLSITEKIDGIFNMICQKINSVIGSYIGLKFFLRRTLGGCEFGVCYDMSIENIDDDIVNDQVCLVDRDPLLVFTISVKSMVPILAGILIIVLVYIASVSKSIVEWITNFPVKGITEIAKKTLKEVALRIADSQLEKLCDVICSFLSKLIFKEIDKMNKYKPDTAKIFLLLIKLTAPSDFNISNDMLSKMLNASKISFKAKFIDPLIENNSMRYLLKIGFLLMLCLSCYIMNFFYHKESIQYNVNKEAADYNEKQNTDEALKKNMKFVDNETIDLQPNND